ncbi:hypothetical protein D3C80_1803110 [compost metagenome]
MKGLTSIRPLRINSTPVANSSWKRKEPRRSSSLAVIAIIGRLMSPPNPSWTMMPRGRSAAMPPASATAAPEHS